eukprot:152570_1
MYKHYRMHNHKNKHYRGRINICLHWMEIFIDLLMMNGWLLQSGLSHCDTPNVVQMKSGETLKIPYNTTETSEFVDKYMSRTYEKHFSYRDGYITLDACCYVLMSLDDDVNDIVIQIKVNDGLLLDNQRYIVNTN